MHRNEVDRRTIIPLRAVSFATGGEISPLAIAIAVGDGRRFIEDRRFCTRLTTYCLNRDVRPHPMLAVDFAEMIDAIDKLVRDKASVREQIQLLPAGVFLLWQDLDLLL